MPQSSGARRFGSVASLLAVTLAGCGKTERTDPRSVAQVKIEAKRQKATCASAVAYDRLKGQVFDQAIADHDGDRSNLDLLADYSSARMEDPVVEGWDPALDLTRCRGRFILDLAPGAERAFAGDRRLQADVRYSAQASADGAGKVYRLSGAEPMIARLAAFKLTAGSYRPPPAIDDQPVATVAPAPVVVAARASPKPVKIAPSSTATASLPDKRVVSLAVTRAAVPVPRADPEVRPSGSAEATVREFYSALGDGNGQAASARMIPEKRGVGAFSPAAMTRFYGRLAEPLRLTHVAAAGPGSYRVRYVYSAGRSRCDGSAVVRVTNRGGRDLIRSIRAVNGC